MNIILFQPFDTSKWGLIGFVAFLASLSVAVPLNNPIPMSQDNTQKNYQTLPEMLHAFKQATAQLGDVTGNPWFKLYACIAAAIVVVWLVLNWVGCRSEFVYLDNIVRNRAALLAPWKRYAWQGNIWFVFHTGLVILSFAFFAALAGAFFFLNWSWINAERNPEGGEIWIIILLILVSIVFAVVSTLVQFLLRSIALPLYFKQTMSLGTALLAVLRLVFTRPLSMAVYLVISFGLWLASIIISCLVTAMTIFATCCVLFSVSCFPIIGGVLVNMVICQLILPLLIFKRCFQLSCLEQFGPQYDVFSVDLQTGEAPVA